MVLFLQPFIEKPTRTAYFRWQEFCIETITTIIDYMKPNQFPPQKQDRQPGFEYEMNPKPEVIKDNYKGSEKLKGKVALITGGDSGIGRATAVHFAREGASIAIAYLNEHEDAEETCRMIEEEGAECLHLYGDIRDKGFCAKLVALTINKYGKLDVLVNNAGVHYPEDSIKEISADNLVKTFETNVFAMFYLCQEALKYMEKGARIINTTSVTSYRGSAHLIDYAATKGAITSFTRSLALNLASKKILVNAVAPGPIWTPLIPASFDGISDFGQKEPLGRAGQPSEVAPAYVYLASEDSSYITGQVIHVNGGEIVGA